MKYYPPYKTVNNMIPNSTWDEDRSLDTTYITLVSTLYYLDTISGDYYPILYTSQYKLLYSHNNIDFTIDNDMQHQTEQTSISGNFIQYKIPFHISQLKTYDQKAILDTTNIYTDVTAYDITIKHLTSFDGTGVITINNAEDISNIDVSFLLSNSIILDSNGEKISGIMFTSGDSTLYPENILKTPNLSNAYIEIYKLNQSNIAVELANDMLLDISNVSISNIIEDEKYLMLLSRRIDPDITTSIDTTCQITSWGVINQGDVIQYTNFSDIEETLTIFNEQIDVTYNIDFTDTSSTHDLLTLSGGHVAKVNFDSSKENSLYRTKKIIFKNDSDLDTVIKVFDGDNTVIYDNTTNDITAYIPITELSNGRGKVNIYILDFVEGQEYNINFSLSIYPFFDDKYITSGLIDKLLSVPDSTEDISYFPSSSFILFGGMSSI